jgi:DNA-binding MarR family transcriptional regulator
MKPYDILNEIKLGIIFELNEAKIEGFPLLQESELARRLNVHPSTISKNAKDLVRLGFIKIKRIESGKGKPKYYSLDEKNMKWKIIVDALEKIARK